MSKQYYIEKINTNLQKAEIEEKVRDIVLEDQFFNIFTAGKKLCRAEYNENTISFCYLSIGRHDMLSPRIHMKVLEKGEGCSCNVFYSKTWGVWCVLIWWHLFLGMCIGISAFRGNMIHLLCYVVIYILGIYGAHQHRMNICNKVVKLLELQLNP
ncbi:MAG: hypothetical protein NC543_01085 [bacterium]|nr:hypothetical protein [bacterium]MCM1375054.1 hypothetical protein [Muribaculum sp.]